MQAYNANGTEVYITKGSIVIPGLQVTGWGSNIDEIEVSSGSSFSEGDYLEFDNEIYRVASIATNTVKLTGLDHTGKTAPLLAAHIDHTDLVKLCLQSVTINGTQVQTISVGTFCNPSATIPAAIQDPGTIDLEGSIDSKSSGYQELVAASTDGKRRYLMIELPEDLGVISTFGIMSRMQFDVSLENELGFSLSMVMGVQPVHRF